MTDNYSCITQLEVEQIVRDFTKETVTLLEGFEGAFVGLTTLEDGSVEAVYSVDIILNILVKCKGMRKEDALEYLTEMQNQPFTPSFLYTTEFLEGERDDNII